ncbi:TetR/AcrR family transcriptional regulator [Curtobacterium sp. MCSS17_016]|uniref:TetR/AcrR family transcriptional regulator n=1 Tax=Curtobacterium sp. MCSS17_016 TaxID=2175644 RepID=UPI000DA8346A|nr:TetR/AcrR family transcriptional regulator [Curtobacterium sp. MCSS17_016]WIE78947.1 helix-turn-helix domain-containing protein [Curtobacterium sp. MCSS17_016]
MEATLGRRERGRQDKSRRILDAARTLFLERGVGGVTTQQIADRADVAVGTLFRYAATKAELLIMVENERFATAIDDGRAVVAVAAEAGAGAVPVVLALLGPVVRCVREHPENGRTYLHELVFGDPAEPNRHRGLALAQRLEDGVAAVLERHARVTTVDAPVLARVVTAVLHIGLTATVHQALTTEELLQDIRSQLAAILGPTTS